MVFSSNYDHVLIHYINYMSNSLISLDFKFIFIRIKSTVNYFEKLNFNINLRFLSGKKMIFFEARNNLQLHIVLISIVVYSQDCPNSNFKNYPV